MQDRRAPAISGTLTPQQALDRLLAGTGLVARINGNTAVVQQPAGDTATLPSVSVYGDTRGEPSKAWWRAAAAPAPRPTPRSTRSRRPSTWSPRSRSR
ncbi:STN domain-containing protein [Achromobacter insuavis]